eukprot:TRINITY_DN45967_c0_g1_i1.p1 TRINITY_DN45967_c0_g1~~TRINITY_DN45967_c0_g1_i1.p1  ORF type:complete len:337 (-),score=60.30 TRINITY_DN45967_c0_g1_i1:509-1519(-)
MKGLTYSEGSGVLLRDDLPFPTPVGNEALIKVIRSSICATDLEIIKGYVPGYNGILGHEFVGRVEKCPSDPSWEGKRVVGEINIGGDRESCSDPVFRRNHASGRTVLGIINHDGTMAEYCCLPVENLLEVPDEYQDRHACFTELLAAACRVVEQDVVNDPDNQKVAVLGDGRLGLLIAQVLVEHGVKNLSLFGRHSDKMDLINGELKRVLTSSEVIDQNSGKFDVAIEATGSAGGISDVLKLTRPMGTIVLKSTVAPDAKEVPHLSSIFNTIVVDEKKIVGSRCGPFDKSLELIGKQSVQKLLEAMIAAEYPLEKGLEAIERAKVKGTLKVQLFVE